MPFMATYKIVKKDKKIQQQPDNERHIADKTKVNSS